VLAGDLAPQLAKIHSLGGLARALNGFGAPTLFLLRDVVLFEGGNVRRKSGRWQGSSVRISFKLVHHEREVRMATKSKRYPIQMKVKSVLTR